MARLFSYVVAEDKGFAPNPTGGYCTLANCKCRCEGGRWRNVVELAEEGDWIVGTGGADKRKSSGHGTLIYAMRVEESLTLEKYYKDKRFKGRLGNCCNQSHRIDTCALISKHYWYFGREAFRIPKEYLLLEKKGPGFKNKFKEEFIQGFTKYLESKYPQGVHGKPCCNGDKSGGCKQTRRKC
ncbi:MAG: hypothetical protein HQ580_15550 [Planctomycetes bacterium]|nr:hypothetical protein [Planctomycetota bacterium]